MKNRYQRLILMLVVPCFIFSSVISVVGIANINEEKNILNLVAYSEEKFIELDFSFTYPQIEEQYNYSVIKVNETNHNRITVLDYETSLPVLPVNLSVFELPFGTKIQSFTFENSTPNIINLSNDVICSSLQFDRIQTNFYETLYESIQEYPNDFVEYHVGGGLSYADRVTYLILRVYPVKYYPGDNQIAFVSDISVNISYAEPVEPIITEEEKQDLLIISPGKYANIVKPLVDFKNNNGVKTKFFTTEEIYNEKLLKGRDEAEKIKYFIKGAIEKWDITNVLLIGGRDGQKDSWDLPVRYSHVVPDDEQEWVEPSFLSDLYYADIYDSEGKFSSWDSNDDDVFSTWNGTFKEEMDLYPDVYLGRLPCRNKIEARAIVNKIMRYEQSSAKDDDWFNNLLLVGGDSYVNKGAWPEGTIVKEGEIACEKAIEKLPGSNPLKVYTTNEDINRQTVNEEFNKGAGFAYFCGHGSTVSWNTHFPDPVDDDSNWSTGYRVKDMIPLRNKEKLPVTVVGGCHNGEFDQIIKDKILRGIANFGFIDYFKGRFWFDGWNTKCWAWWLTSKPNAGAIATIANTGLGTHGDGDQDLNGIIDYLEVLDGWLELRFFELYGMENEDNLGLNHGQTMTEYLHKFLGDEAKMDVKMIQQWELFGDPSLKIGGYS